MFRLSTTPQRVNFAWSYTTAQKDVRYLRHRCYLAPLKSFFFWLRHMRLLAPLWAQRGSFTVGLLWSTFDQSNLQMRSDLIRSKPIKIKSEIKFGSWLSQSLKSLKTSKRIRGDLSTIWEGSKQIKRINRPAISSFAEADLSLAARLLSRFKQIWFNLFPYFQGTVIPLLSL